jgi:hypothetical protein
MKDDELVSHTRTCLGREVSVSMRTLHTSSTLPVGAPVICLPTTAVVADASPDPPQEEEQKAVLVGDVPVLPLTSLPSTFRRLLTVEEIDKAIQPYIGWRGQVGSTQHDRAAKTTIVDSPEKKAKLSTTLRRYFCTAASLMPDLFAGELDVRLLVDVEVVKSLFQHQETSRLRVGGRTTAGVGNEAKYQLRNELKKVVVFVMHRQSLLAGRVLFPEQHPAYHLVAASARYVGQRRKREQRTRMRFHDHENRIMTGEEQDHVLAECEEQLEKFVGLGRRLSWNEERDFIDYLVVALLILLLGPRQEVLAQTTTMNLKPPRSPGNPRNTYYLQVPAELLKDGQPFDGAIPEKLTAAMSYYTQCVRPLTVAGPMWVKASGKARENFSDSSRRVTMRVIGRPITAHRFRHSQVTDETNRAEMSWEVRRDMATHRGQSVQVQEDYYNMRRLDTTRQQMQAEMLRRAEVVRERRVGVESGAR